MRHLFSVYQETVQKAEKGYLIKKDVQGEKVDLYTHR